MSANRFGVLAILALVAVGAWGLHSDFSDAWHAAVFVMTVGCWLATLLVARRR